MALVTESPRAKRLRLRRTFWWSAILLFVFGLVLGSLLIAVSPFLSGVAAITCGGFWVAALVSVLGALALEPPFRGELL